MSVTHGAHQREAVSSERQVQIGEENIKLFCRNMLKRVADVRSCHHFKPVAMQPFVQHHKNRIIVLND
jgi:hypothetical protein